MQNDKKQQYGKMSYLYGNVLFPMNCLQLYKQILRYIMDNGPGLYVYSYLRQCVCITQYHSHPNGPADQKTPQKRR